MFFCFLSDFLAKNLYLCNAIPTTTLQLTRPPRHTHWATRELLMNAICHRDNESNGPVQFYQYDDRIEILNPGGHLV